MIKQDYIDRIYETGEVSKKDISFVINYLFKLMASDIKNGEKVTISNFGTFEQSKSKPTNIYSPYDGRLIEGKVQTRILFKPSKFLKEECDEEE